jgi:hypothetical protein
VIQSYISDLPVAGIIDFYQLSAEIFADIDPLSTFRFAQSPRELTPPLPVAVRLIDSNERNGG